MGDHIELVVRIVHIVLGTFWAGAAIMVAMFITPAVRALGAAGSPFMRQLVEKGRFPIYMAAAGLLTVITGAIQFYTRSGGELGLWTETPYGMTMLVGGTIGLIAFAIGIGVNAPTGARMGRLAAEIQASGGPPNSAQQAEMGRLQDRMRLAGIVTAVLILVSVSAMAAARYL